MSQAYFLTFCCIFFGIIPSVFGQQPIAFEETEKMLLIGKSITFFEDQASELGIHEILSPEIQGKFVKHDKEIFNRTPTKSTFWFKVTVQNKTQEDIWLELGEANFAWYLDFYRPDSLGNYQEATLLGSLRPQENKEFPSSSYCVLLDKQNEHEPKTFYFSVNGGNFPLTYIFKIGTTTSLIKHRQDNIYRLAFFIGLVVAIIIYNLFLFYSTKEVIYIVYVIYLFFLLFLVPFHNGYPFAYQSWVWKHFVLWQNFFFIPATTFAILYMNKSLVKSVFFEKIIYMITSFLVIFIPLIHAFELLDIYINSITAFFTILHNFALLSWGGYVWIKGFQGARFFSIAWLFVLGGTLLYALATFSIIPIHFITQNSLYIGFSSEILFFALALGDRLNILKKEKDEFQTKNTRLIEEHNKVLENKVNERTIELQKNNDELKFINHQLNNAQEELQEQRLVTDKKNKDLASFNKKMVANTQMLQKLNDKMKLKNKALAQINAQVQLSINSAQAIQKAILPDNSYFENLFQDHFIINRPRDVVSGDFYWLSETDGKITLIAADCTGHGVPGAFMTLIGYKVLDKIIYNIERLDPAQILDQLNQGVIDLLKPELTGNVNGMDIVVLVIEKLENDTTKVAFSGARNGLYFYNFKEKELQMISGSKKSIGGHQNQVAFSQGELLLPKDSILYLGSDGLKDQNDAERKRFGKKRLNNLLNQNIHLNLEVQKSLIEQELDQFMEGTTQRDDILWIGVKL